jgi:hypothetical protein
MSNIAPIIIIGMAAAAKIAVRPNILYQAAMLLNARAVSNVKFVREKIVIVLFSVRPKS